MKIEDLSEVRSYNFWGWWWSKSPNAARLPEYKFPMPYGKWLAALGGRQCPFHRLDPILEFRPAPVIDGFEDGIQGVFCICALLQSMEQPNRVWETRYLPKTLESIEEWDEPKGAAARTREIKSEVDYWIKRPYTWRFLYGGFGAGKSHILQAIKTAMRGLAGYVTTADLAEWVFRATRSRLLDELIDGVATVPFLLLDDFGAQHPNPYTSAALYAILNRRYELGTDAPVFVTSNKTPEEMLKDPDDNTKRVGDRLSDTALVEKLVTKQKSWRGRVT